jgi:hypothetical protein
MKAKETKALKAKSIAGNILQFYKAASVKTDCLGSFEIVVIEYATKETKAAMDSGFKFSGSRFNPLFNATQSMIRNAYSMYITEVYG